jgi:hypothetical protein
MALATKTVRTLVAAGTTNAAAGTTRGVLGLQTALGGILTYKIVNGGVGPTIQCVANVLVAHNASVPAAGSAGATWKTVYTVGNGILLNTIGEWSYTFGPEIMNIEVEFTGNTGQAVTVEAFVSEFTSIA